MELVTGKVEKAQKILLYGTEGIGKSTFASKFPDPLFIDTEGSTNHLDVRRTPTPTSWSMIKDQLLYVKQNPSLCRTLVIDTADWAERLCIQHICDINGFRSIEDPGYGKGFTMLAEEFGRFLNFLTDLKELGINVVLTAHAMIKQTELPEETGKYEFWTLKLEKKTSPMIKEWADMVLFANYKTLLVEDQKTKSIKARGGQRFMYTTHRTTWDAKNRHDLPEELEFDYAQIAHLFEKDLRDLQAPVPTPASTPEPEPPVIDADGVVQEELPPAKTEPVGIVNTFQLHDWRNEKADWKAPPVPSGKEYLKPLYDLMETNGISDMMLREICSDKGFVTLQQPLEDFPEDLITGLLISQWDTTMEMLAIYRDNHMPF